jgi:23S rRNA pseudouridine2604 synthase
MSFRLRLKYYLVHSLFKSNAQAMQLILNGCVEVDGLVVKDNCIISDTSELKVEGKLVRAKTEYVYLKFNKPVGYESTLNPSIPENLSGFFENYTNLSIAGRLDKQSEGLLLLSNNGKWVQDICHPNHAKEKEYLVGLTEKPSAVFIETFKSGVKIGNYVTKPCVCESISPNLIRVVLTEGKNRQIRRMCRRLGNEVLSLKRIRIAKLKLNELKSGEFEIVKDKEIEML